MSVGRQSALLCPSAATPVNGRSDDSGGGGATGGLGGGVGGSGGGSVVRGHSLLSLAVAAATKKQFPPRRLRSFGAASCDQKIFCAVIFGHDNNPGVVHAVGGGMMRRYFLSPATQGDHVGHIGGFQMSRTPQTLTEPIQNIPLPLGNYKTTNAILSI